MQRSLAMLTTLTLAYAAPAAGAAISRQEVINKCWEKAYVEGQRVLHEPLITIPMALNAGASTTEWSEVCLEPQKEQNQPEKLSTSTRIIAGTTGVATLISSMLYPLSTSLGRCVMHGCSAIVGQPTPATPKRQRYVYVGALMTLGSLATYTTHTALCTGLGACNI